MTEHAEALKPEERERHEDEPRQEAGEDAGAPREPRPGTAAQARVLRRDDGEEDGAEEAKTVSLEAELAAAVAARPRSLMDEFAQGTRSAGGGVDGSAAADASKPSAVPVDLTKLVTGAPNKETDAALRDVLHARLFEGQGETLLEIGPMDAAAVDAAVSRLAAITLDELGAGAHLVHTRDSGRGAKDTRVRADVLVRLPPSEQRHLNLRVAVVGNVDAGKSTLVGVLVGGALDNGRGSARLKVLKHKHETESGRTSSISEDQHLGFDEAGRVLNAQSASNPVLSSEGRAGGGAADGGAQTAAAVSSSHGSNWQEVVNKSSKVVSFIDLAGHEKYLKTTMFGMTAHDPDYALVVVGANHGITRMTKEHLGVAIALGVPVFVVVTKADLAPENVLKETIAQLMRLLKLPGARKKPFVVRTMDDVVVASRAFRSGFVAPIFSVSNVSGANMGLVHAFMNLLPSRKLWSAQGDDAVEFLIDQFFNVPGIGTVVAGTLVSGRVNTGQMLQLGPDSTGAFKPVVIKSIHHMRLPASTLLTGQSGAFLMRALKRKEHVRSMGLRKGMVLLDATTHPRAAWRFRCDVLVLHSSTTMRCNYQPVLHVRNVRQSARITQMDREVLRTGTKASIEFEFLFRPEFIRVGSRLIFREGKTKGIGNITHVFAADEEPPPSVP
mmetsp:Transcript_3599/g.9339  ORF Transcript_3599/g.9339 Transcript_3599/m.9339 type:complete len:669 (-) Transcript_3599:162-2168(-)